MTILPKKKERTQTKGSSSGAEGHSEEHPHHQHYHQHSPPRAWGSLPGRPAPAAAAAGGDLPPDASKRSSDPADGLLGHNGLSGDSGPSHGSKRRHRETRTLYATRSKSKSGSASAAAAVANALPAVAAEGLDLGAGPSVSECSVAGAAVAPDQGVCDASQAATDREPGSVSPSGYNSGDEYGDKPGDNWTPEEVEEMERRFEKKLRKKGLTIKKMGEDGACLFRAAG